MKKSLRADYRREVVELIEKHKLSTHTICTSLGVHPNTVRNWITGRRSPSTADFERLKQLASGGTTQPVHAQQPSPMSGIENLLKTIDGRLIQLTEQVAYLQKGEGRFEEKIDSLKKDMEDCLRRTGIIEHELEPLIALRPEIESFFLKRRNHVPHAKEKE